MFVLKSGGYKTHFLSSTSNSLVMIEWRLFEVKQHKYKLVLGWMTIWLVVHLIRHLNVLPEIL